MLGPNEKMLRKICISRFPVPETDASDPWGVPWPGKERHTGASRLDLDKPNVGLISLAGGRVSSRGCAPDEY